jgi:capsular polysaccharide biosynthesis protein
MQIKNFDSNLNIVNNDDFSLKQFILNLKYWYIYLLKSKKYIIYSILISLIIALFTAFFESPEYTAITTFAMEEDKGSSSGLGESSWNCKFFRY